MKFETKYKGGDMKVELVPKIFNKAAKALGLEFACSDPLPRQVGSHSTYIPDVSGYFRKSDNSIEMHFNIETGYFGYIERIHFRVNSSTCTNKEEIKGRLETLIKAINEAYKEDEKFRESIKNCGIGEPEVIAAVLREES